MRLQRVHNIDLSVCPECGGIWFHADQLRLLMAQDPQVLQELEFMTAADIRQSREGSSTLICPDCDLLLDRYHYMYNSPVLIHACHRCGGFWVAEGELGKMQQWRDQAHRPLNPKERVAAALAQARVAHDRDMLHHQNVADLCNLMRLNQPGWFGFLP